MTNGERKRQQTKTINDKAKQKAAEAATTTITTTKEGKNCKTAANKPSALAADFTMKSLK